MTLKNKINIKTMKMNMMDNDDGDQDSQVIGSCLLEELNKGGILVQFCVVSQIVS